MPTASAVHPICHDSGSTVSDFIALLKPRVMSLVVFTGIVGLILAPGTISLFTAIIAICMIALGSGAAGAINMWYDRDIDQLMERTKKRPIPAGKVAPGDALAFAIIIAFFSVLVMAFAVNYLAAFLLATAILYYVGIYTCWLKRRTPQNIVIGGAAGAFPPLIGWAAVTGNISLFPILLFTIIFFWTCPHFWALSLYCFKDYEKAKVPMLPNIRGIPVTKQHIVFYAILTATAAFLPYHLQMAGAIYGIGSTALNTYFLLLSLRLYREPGITHAKKLFFYSIFYLFALFSLLVFDHYLTLGQHSF
jgi:protoheme IX farnesyltransferase